jgi:hypothetical protein
MGGAHREGSPGRGKIGQERHNWSVAWLTVCWTEWGWLWEERS